MARPQTMGGPGAIPLTEIVAYLQLWEIASLEARVVFMNRMRLLDRTYLRLTFESMKKK